jgi:uncharacterized protein
MRVALTGSHGLIARHLVPALRAEGHDVVAVVRGEPASGEVGWDPLANRLDPAALATDAVVHLAGVPLAGRRWNRAYRQSVLDSRLNGTRLLAERIARSGSPPGVLLSASAVGFYGSRGDETLTEDSGPGKGFLADVCRQWEAATTPAADAGVRVVCLRSGIVLATDGGALKPQLPLFRLGLGARLGDGRQWLSWIAIEDEVGAILHALNHESLHGPVNLTAPEPITNADYTRTLGQVLRRPTPFAVPADVLRLVLGKDMAEELLLTSQRVEGEALAASGYRFRHATLGGALTALVGS